MRPEPGSKNCFRWNFDGFMTKMRFGIFLHLYFLGSRPGEPPRRGREVGESNEQSAKMTKTERQRHTEENQKKAEEIFVFEQRQNRSI